MMGRGRAASKFSFAWARGGKPVRNRLSWSLPWIQLPLLIEVNALSTHKLTKKELKHDSFVESTEKGLELVQKHGKTVGLVAAAVVILIVGGSYMQKSKVSSTNQASYLLYQGEGMLSNGNLEGARVPLQECIDRYGDTEFGRLARVGLAKAYLAAGANDDAVASVDLWLKDVPESNPANRALKVARATALSSLARHADAATAFGELAASATAPAEVFDFTIRQADNLRLGGQPAEALKVLEALDGRRARGEITAPAATDLRSRLEVLRAIVS
jgi:predicted negative regulator of RcsB-dependent stress response